MNSCTFIPHIPKEWANRPVPTVNDRPASIEFSSPYVTRMRGLVVDVSKDDDVYYYKGLFGKNHHFVNEHRILVIYTGSNTELKEGQPIRISYRYE